jgi:hypothetical protein
MMDARSYLKVSGVNLVFLVAGILIGPFAVRTFDLMRVVYAQVEKPPARAASKIEQPKPPGEACDDSKYECVTVGIASGTAAFGTLLANRLASDQLMVNGFEPLKLHDATLAALVRKGILSNSDVEQIVEAARVKRPLRLKNQPQ